MTQYLKISEQDRVPQLELAVKESEEQLLMTL